MAELIYAARPIRRRLRVRSLENALDELEKLRRAPRILLSPGWDLPHILDHCARSIGYAMAGFPDMKHPLFRAVAGRAAFHVFDLRGYMRHDLGAEIPGSRLPEKPLSFEEALENLQQTVRAFEDFQGKLMPHFAYGTLSKNQYERANAMHIGNHLSALEY